MTHQHTKLADSYSASPLKPFKAYHWYKYLILQLNENYLICLSGYAIHLWFSIWMLIVPQLQNSNQNRQYDNPCPNFHPSYPHTVAPKMWIYTFTDLQLCPIQTFLESKKVRTALINEDYFILLLFTHLFRAAILWNFPFTFPFSSGQHQHSAAICFPRTFATYCNKWH